ncbi:hypothetical protein [Haloferula sp. A504]|uniref:hypothetical protein n=1 Tax=Haloferula sp. A504 TaxID=3373601 RepID=UPI0031BD6A43|nr:hypothetical protein [Verrucomicrobiaceae bacterium E54]
MPPSRKSIRLGSKTGGNRRREKASFTESLRLAQARARVRANRPANRRGRKWVRAAIAETYPVDDSPHLLLRMFRWMLGLALAPLAVVTSWTFFNLFSSAALDHLFWTSAPFWYFATGAVLMIAWFATGLLWDLFLYLYVLGHELTHILFIRLFRGTVAEWGVSVDGGYVTTDKTNILIALAPYFVPLWAALTVGIYACVGVFVDLSPAGLKSLYALLGFFWAFHLLWTLWMIPRDQPDLRENGTFLSLVIIYLANLLILVTLTCLASPDMSFRGFGVEWIHNARAGFDAAQALAVRFLR